MSLKIDIPVIICGHCGSKMLLLEINDKLVYQCENKKCGFKLNLIFEIIGNSFYRKQNNSK